MIGTAFYIAALIAVLSTVMVITRYNIMHALLYLVVSLLAVAVVLYLYGAPFMAALEVIVYAGAIMVLLIFFVMMLNLGKESAAQEKLWLKPRIWIFPSLLCIILLGELVFLVLQNRQPVSGVQVVNPKEVGIALFGPYILAVELTGMLLMAGIVGAYHLGRQKEKTLHRFLENNQS
ncbi:MULTISPECIES: NADH-quinone oxidoreductase subunit J [Chitinophaga]|uniref:NADH-quinone oxidoreductase subunit J n=1 Tax=Chitinophaga TaxID=79328 RepID=UPI000DBF9861|nr:NADH-quinone oxidoreductase subunit J [Chitinophaga ginsengisegetis]MDR6568445.1 NADH-quinone oxidoreductase subunit J [Chitinophaga ginsengisegetis]MDR6648324.1 NADH-quinone oxidoreductase subunit J [Chitinophaga ginsengisegetis]MDR6654526.1 NADH-quinone oxidoreductase subunit J [Chitinophaga ginsengisegetis]